MLVRDSFVWALVGVVALDMRPSFPTKKTMSCVDWDWVCGVEFADAAAAAVADDKGTVAPGHVVVLLYDHPEPATPTKDTGVERTCQCWQPDGEKEVVTPSSLPVETVGVTHYS